jgi:formylmethanofuran--tetrahydromethanopterin N-formyltransferase
MHIGPTEILDQHAEAFSVRYARLIVTAIDEHWVEAAVQAATGYATSVIGCDCEAGVDRRLVSSETPDGRPGVSLLFFAFTTKSLAGGVANRIGQCVLTCPTTSCFNGLSNATESVPLGDWIRFFGDGYESSETNDSRYRWRIPVMDGDFLVDAEAGVAHGIGGGNLVLHGVTQIAALAAAQRAATAADKLPGVITPFPGGVCRSGSKVGSRYKNLIASTAEEYCPSLRDEIATQLVCGATCAYEIIINGVDLASVKAAMLSAIEAAAEKGVVAIGARSFAGRLGKHRISLHKLPAKP